MADEQEQRFELSVNLVVNEITGGRREPFFSSELKYPNISYGGVVVIEGLLVEVQQRLVAVGIANAADSEVIKGQFSGQLVPAEKKAAGR